MHAFPNETLSRFRGTGVALVTPFTKDGAVDYDALKALIEHVLQGGVNMLITMGTTGEAATLSANERKEVMRFTAEVNRGRATLIAGFGGNNTQALCSEIAASDLSIFDGILSASPYYNKPSQEGIYRHYMELDNICSIPILLYNVPGRTASNMTAATTLKIATESHHIIGIKEASGQFAQIMDICRLKSEGFLVLSGDDAITLPMISTGADGVISVIANAYPAIYSQMVAHALNGNFKDALPLHNSLLEITDLIFKEGSPAGIKELLFILGLTKKHLRLPLVEVSENLQVQLEVAKRRLDD